MKPFVFFCLVASAVACGIAAAPYVGITIAIALGLILIVISAVVGFWLLRVTVAESASFANKAARGVQLYFHVIPKAWQMLVGPNGVGERFSVRRRLDGFVALCVCLVWAIVVVAAILLLFPTSRHP